MPALYIKDAGTFKTVVQPWVKNAGAWKPALNVWVKTSGSWQLVWTGFTAETDAVLIGTGTGSTGVVNTRTADVIVTGGIGPFTYSWTKTGGDPMNINGASSRNAYFYTTLGPGQSAIATFQCTVTDTTTGVQVVTNTLTAELYN